MSACIHVAADIGALADDAAVLFGACIESAVSARGRAAVALSGGSTPCTLYARLASPAYRSLPWDRLWIFFSDERCVPADHPDSNFALAHDALLARVPIAPDHVARMACERDPQTAAQDYAARLAAFAPRPDAMPVLDLILLGLGTDGHTASLFPDSPALKEGSTHAVVAAPGPTHTRLTFTFPVLNAARALAFLVSGGEKADVVHRILSGPSDLPAARLRPAGRMHWFLDAAAARLLND